MTRDELIVLAKSTAAQHNLPGELVCAVIEQESAWKTNAFRHEPAFELRYGPNYRRMFPDCPHLGKGEFYSSHGLMQVMLCVAWELNLHRGGLDDLFLPEVGIEVGCKLLVIKLHKAGWDKESVPTREQTHKGLLLWNGGGRPAYADEVIARIPKYVEEAA